MDKTNILPSKKFTKSIIAILLCLAVILIIGYFYNGDKNIAGNQLANIKVVDKTFGDVYSQDTDGDGLLDWEEDLYGTDKNKVDSNGNGIPDLAEMKPNGNKAPTSGNVTDDFSKQFMSSVFAMKGSGGLTKENIDKIIDASAENIVSKGQNDTYSMNDIKILKNETTQGLKTYLEKFVAAINSLPLKSDNSAELLSNALTSEDETILLGISAITSKYNSAILSMLSLSVPQKYANTHLAIINSVSKIMNLDISMSKAFDDPLEAYGAINNYQKVLDGYKYNIDIFTSLLNKK